MTADFRYELTVIFGMGVITFFIRVLPFLNLFPQSWLDRLEAKKAIFPTVFLTLLVLYCLSTGLKAFDLESMYLIGCATLVALLHWWRGSLILSLGLGTLVYVMLLNR